MQAQSVQEKVRLLGQFNFAGKYCRNRNFVEIISYDIQRVSKFDQRYWFDITANIRYPVSRSITSIFGNR